MRNIIDHKSTSPAKDYPTYPQQLKGSVAQQGFPTKHTIRRVGQYAKYMMLATKPYKTSSEQ